MINSQPDPYVKDRGFTEPEQERVMLLRSHDLPKPKNNRRGGMPVGYKWPARKITES